MARSFSQSVNELLHDLEATRDLSEMWSDVSPEEMHRMQVNANRLLVYGADANAAKQAGSDVLVLLELIETMDKVVEAVTRSVPGHYTAHWKNRKLESLEFTPDPPARDVLEKRD